MTKEEAIKSFEEDNRTMLENKTAYINELKARGMEFEDRMVSYIDESVERNELAISALKPTCKIDESNFSMEQYRADLQSAYDCGYNKALSENKENIVEDIIAECEKTISEYDGCEVFTYAYGVRDMAQTIKAIAESRLSEFEKAGE